MPFHGIGRSLARSGWIPFPIIGLPTDKGVETWLVGYGEEVTSKGIEVIMPAGAEVIEADLL